MASRRLSVVCAVIVALVLAADGAIVAVRFGGGRPRVPAALEPMLAELEAFVERERGLSFERPVEVRLASDEQFESALRRLRREERGSDGEEDERTFVGLFRALGLVDEDFDPAAIEESSDERILGFYDPARERLFVRGTGVTPAVRRVLVHELTHALDDQHFGLDRPDLDQRDDESAVAFQALVEGDAARVESSFFASLPTEERRQADIEVEPSSPTAGPLPRVFEALLAFPYVAGESFVDALWENGGAPRLDAAFADPPDSTEAVLHPERFLAGEGARPVADPPADGRSVDEGVLGELVLRLVLQSALDRPAAARAADGWGGDRYVAWSDGDDRLCVRVAVVMDTPADRADLVDGLRRWAGRHRGAAVADGDPVTLTRCA